MNINVQLYTSFVADESVITKEHYSALCTLQAGCAWRPRAPAPYAAGWQCLEAPPRMLQAGCAWRPRPVCCRLAVPGGPAPYAVRGGDRQYDNRQGVHLLTLLLLLLLPLPTTGAR